MDKDKKRFSVRFDFMSPEDVAAWEVLSKLPYGARSHYIINAILEKSDEHPLKSTLMYIKDSIERKIDSINDTLSNSNFIVSTNHDKTIKSKDDSSIPNEVMNFIKGL